MIRRASSATKNMKLTTCSGSPGEALPQLGILRRDPDRARVEMAGAHHHAARGDQRRGREAHLVGAEQRGDDDVAAGLQLAVRLHPDPRAQVVQHERLLRLREPDLPRRAGEEDRRERRGAGAAVVAGDQHMVGVRLRDAGGDRADADLRDELHRDARLRIRAAEVVDQLLQILDRVDVVVRRRRDQPDAGRRQPHAGDVAVDLVPGQLAALARLRALRHLDLQLVGIREVVRVDAEAARGDLLDRGAARVSVRLGVNRSGSSPPSPVFERPPILFIAIARFSCASRESEPSDIAPVAKRLTISFAGSTSSIGTPPSGSSRKRIRPRRVERRVESSLTSCAYSS